MVAVIYGGNIMTQF